MEEEGTLKINCYHIEDKKIFSPDIGEQILKILAFHIKEFFHKEVLKAYAIMTRTYLIKRMRRFNGKGCPMHPEADICNDPSHCMGTVEIQDIPKTLKKQLQTAIEETSSLVLTFKGNFVEPYYHHTCGGATQNSENILGHTIPYARKVLCDHCQHTSSSWQTTVEITLEQMEEILKVRFPKATPLQGPPIANFIDQVERDEEGRVLQIKVGDTLIKGKDIQEKLGLPSSRFGWQPTKLRFYVQGKGHGVGLCQYGAQQLAAQGMEAEEILKYYFTGVEIEKMPKWSIKKPLQGKIILVDPGHGGKDPGVFRNHIQEKVMSLKIALHLEKILQEAGSQVMLTRSGDEYLTLGERLDVNHKLQPHFMLSIHGNDHPTLKASLSQIYIYPGDKQARQLGEEILRQFKEKGLEVQAVQEEDFFMTRESRNSTLILDIGFFSSPGDYEKKIATCIYHALLSYWKIDKS